MTGGRTAYNVLESFVSLEGRLRAAPLVMLSRQAKHLGSEREILHYAALRSDVVPSTTLRAGSELAEGMTNSDGTGYILIKKGRHNRRPFRNQHPYCL
jgi:hypothetical protein